MSDGRNVCVFCGANTGDDPVFATVAAELGRALAEQGHGLVYGGGRVGLMGIVADAALAAGGRVHGYIPQALVDREVGHRGLTEMVVTDSMHTRKQAMSDRADGFVALPGGYGTLDEVIEILTWNQIGIIAKPVAFLDVPVATLGGSGYFESLFRFFDDAAAAGLIMPAHRTMAQRATTVAEAIRIATGPAPASPSKWTDPSVR
ncbi:MAG: TIGR00730 family Rossman fold protein [Acidimicrobiia bacterium]